jgi:hypothetical protein
MPFTARFWCKEFEDIRWFYICYSLSWLITGLLQEVFRNLYDWCRHENRFSWERGLRVAVRVWRDRSPQGFLPRSTSKSTHGGTVKWWWCLRWVGGWAVRGVCVRVGAGFPCRRSAATRLCGHLLGTYGMIFRRCQSRPLRFAGVAVAGTCADVVCWCGVKSCEVMKPRLFRDLGACHHVWKL